MDAGQRIYGFLLSRGVYTTLDAPGSESGFTVAQGINNCGQVVGFSATTADGPSHGFVLKHGVFTTTDVPGAFWTEVYSINAKGEIVGTYEDATGIHDFLGKPVHKRHHTN